MGDLMDDADGLELQLPDDKTSEHAHLLTDGVQGKPYIIGRLIIEAVVSVGA